jgi:dynein heavy chain 2
VLFRGRTYQFDEFLTGWTDRLRAGQASSVTVRLQKDIDFMREFAGVLKFCRGEFFSADHWVELFRLVKLPRGSTSLEKLTFGDLLRVQQHVVAAVDALKNL